MGLKIAWFSGGATSAVACKLALEEHPDLVVVSIEIPGSHHPDHDRFLAECGWWFQREIFTVRNEKYLSHFEVIEKTRFINGPRGARCTSDLKKNVRKIVERDVNPSMYVWGFEAGKKEQARADRIKNEITNIKHVFPLIDRGIDKRMALAVLSANGIEPPAMYRLGFPNANCVGCVKGGQAYWNHIRNHFPEVFARMAKLERQLGHSCLKRYFLDELPHDAGKEMPIYIADCGSVGEGCEISLSREFFARD